MGKAKYESTRSIKCGGKSMTVIKTDDQIKVLYKGKVMYDGNSYNYHKWRSRFNREKKDQRRLAEVTSRMISKN